MIEVGEDLAFGAKAAEKALRRQLSRMHHLDCDLLLILFVGAIGEIDPSHASFTEQADQSIGTNRLSCKG